MGQGYVELATNDSKLVAGLNAAKNKFEAWGKSVTALGMSLARVGGVIAAAFSPAIAVFANYEQALANLRAAANPTAENMARLREQIEAVGRSTGTDFSDVTNAYAELLKAGKSVDEVLSGLGETAIKFARVSGMDMAATATVLVDALNMFARDGMTATQAANIMNQAADASTISLREVAESFAAGGGAAGQFGQSMRDTATILAIFAKEGSIKGADAGTALKTLMLRIATGSESAGAAITELGLNVRDAAGNVRPMIEIIGQLETALEGRSGADRDRLLADLGGSYGIRGLSALLQSGTRGWRAMQESMDTALTVEQKFAVMTETLYGSMKKLWVGVQDIAVAVGEALAPALNVAGQVLMPILILVAEMARRNQVATQIIAALGVALMAAAAILVTFGISISMMAPAIGALASVASGVGLAFAWLPTLILWSDYARYSILGLTGVFRAFGVEMREIWEPLGVIDDLFDSLWDTITGFASGTIFAEMGESIKRMWTVLMDSPIGEFLKTIGFVVVAIAAINTAIIGLAGYLAYLGMANSFDLLAQAVRAVMPVIESLFTLWVQGVGHISTMFSALFSPLIRLGRGVISTIQSVYVAAAQAFSTAWSTTVAEFGRLADGLSATANQAWGGIVAAFNVGDWEGIWQIIQATVLLAWAQIKGFIEPTFNAWGDALTDAFRGAVLAIKSAFVTLWGEIKAMAFESLAAIANSILDVQARALAAARIVSDPILAARLATGSTTMAAITAESRATLGTGIPDALNAAAATARTDASASVTAMQNADAGAWFNEQALRVDRDTAAAAGNASEVASRQAELDQLTEAARYAAFMRQWDEADRVDAIGTPTRPTPGGEMAANAIRTTTFTMGNFGRDAMNILGASVAQTPEAKAAQQRERQLTELRNIADRIAALREEIAPRAE